MITLRYVAGQTFVSAHIRAAEYGYGWTHVECVTDVGDYLGSVYDPTGRADGVRERLPGYDGIVPGSGDSRECLVKVPCTDAQAAAFLAAMRSQIGKPYDLVDVIADFINGRDWRNPDAWWCSELVQWALEKALEMMAAVAVEKFSPRDNAIFVSALGVLVPAYKGSSVQALTLRH